MSKKTSKDVKTKPTKALTGKPSTGPMDLGMLEQMIALMSQHDVSALDVRDGDKRVILKRGAQFVTAPAASHTAPHAPAPSAAQAGARAASRSAAAGRGACRTSSRAQAWARAVVYAS